MALLHERMVQIKKEMRELAGKHTVTQPHASEDSQPTTAPSKCKEEKTPERNKEGSGENEDDQDAKSQKAPLPEEAKEGEKKLKDQIAKLEQQYDFLSDAVQ
jgi:hypothetical protein